MKGRPLKCRFGGHGPGLLASIAFGIGGGWLAAMPGSALADDYIVYSPDVSPGKSELELRGSHSDDGRADRRELAAEASVAYGANAWWKPELYLARYVDSPDSGRGLIGYEFENTFRLTPRGRYPFDVGLLAAYERNTRAGGRDAMEIGALIELERGRFSHRVNLIWERQVGSGGDRHREFRGDYAGSYRVHGGFRVGLETYARPADRAYQAGPVLAGEWRAAHADHELEWRVGILAGINAAAPERTVLLQLAYESN